MRLANFRLFPRGWKKKRRLIILATFTVLSLIVLVNLEIFLFQYKYIDCHFIPASDHYEVSMAREASRQPRARSIECKGGEILTNGVRKFSNFTADLNISQPCQFDSGVKNFSYVFNQIDKDSVFSKEFTRYETFPTSREQKYRGYISVLNVGQELSQCTRHLLELCLLASTSHRKVVMPRMKNGRMGSKGLPFGDFFNVSSLNKHLTKFGYSELASEDEFLRNCDSERKRVVVVFYVKPEKELKFTFIDRFGTYEKVEKVGWMNCSGQVTSVPKNLVKYQNNTDFYCMHGSRFADVETFNKNILGDSECVYINLWVYLSNVNWNRLLRPGAPIPFRILHWYSDPATEIIKDASAFQDKRIQRPYVAMHIRGVKFRNKSFLQPCFELALEFVNALRRTRKVKTLFLSTDMSQFGGITNKDHSSHKLFAEMSRAVTYDPNISKVFKSVDRWKVSLSEVRLMSQADHLITIGHGSFGSFIRNRYFWEHSNRENWTLSTVCFETAKRYF